MFYPHTRQLGSQPGFQMNPVRDNTDGFVTDIADQSAAFVGRFKRGRIDRPFKVNRGNLARKLGAPESLRISALNECYVHVYEAVNNGTREGIISRLTVAGALNNYCVFSIDATSGLGSFTSQAAIPTTGNWLFYLKDLDCYNDGVLFEVNALKNVDATGTAIATKLITLRLRDPSDSTLRYEVQGSLDTTAIDEYGDDASLVSKFAMTTSSVSIVCNQAVSIPTTAECYGKAADGSEKLSKNATPLILFTEGGTAYTSDDYDRVLSALEKSTFDYGYMESGGSQATALLAKMITLNVRANRCLIIDVPGDLTPSAAATWVAQLSVNTHYVHFYWAPLRTDDPVNGGKATIGCGGLQVGLRCARNAQTNSYGLAPKNYAIAGKDWSITRTGVEQLTNPDEFQLSDLADAKINPVIYQSYNAGSAFVFSDVLTACKTNGYKKLVTVAEMSSSLDDMIAKAGKQFLLMPMSIALTRMDKFLKGLLDGAKASGWLVESTDPALGAKGYSYSVARNAQRPVDRMDVTYYAHYDGIVRAIFSTQTISN